MIHVHKNVPCSDVADSAVVCTCVLVHMPFRRRAETSKAGLAKGAPLRTCTSIFCVCK